MSNDPVQVLKRFSGETGVSFSLLSDPDSKIIGAFGLRDEHFARSSPWFGLARPIILVVDAAGTVRHRFSSLDYRRRPDVDAVLDRLRGSAGG